MLFKQIHNRTLLFALLCSLSCSYNSPIEAMDTLESLLHAVANGKTALVKQLIADGADVNAENRFGLRPLNFALPFEHTDINEMLIEAGSDVNARDGEGKTPLEIAASVIGGQNYPHETNDPFYWIDTIRLLLAAGARVDTKDKSGNTPLHVVVEHNRSTPAIKELIKAGADVNAQDNEGLTPLMRAADCFNASCARNVSVVKALLAAGADINMRTHSGDTALDLARKSKARALTRYSYYKNMNKVNKQNILEHEQNISEHDLIIQLLEQASKDINTLKNAHNKLWAWGIFTKVDAIQPKLLGVRLKELRAQLPQDLHPALFEAIRLKREYPVQWKQYITDRR